MRSDGPPPVVAIVGAGRVGSALGRLLHQRGWRIGPVITRSIRTAREARRRIGCGQPQAGLSDRVLWDALLSADVILITTPDRAIGETASTLAAFGGSNRSGARQAARLKKRAEESSSKNWRGKIVLHTSGALGSDVLKPLEVCGAAIGSLHPLQTFSGRTLPSLVGTTCAIEGSPAATRMARRICRQLGGVPVLLPAASKAAYHAGAALAAGHVLALVETAARVLMKAGFSRKRAIGALLPLTRQTLENFERLGSSLQGGGAAWTGPLSRADFAVIRRHARALRRFPREYGEAYAALSRLALNVLGHGSGVKKRELEKALAASK